MLKKCLFALAIVGAFSFATAQDASAHHGRPLLRGAARVATAPARIVGRRVYHRRVWGPTVVVAPAPVTPYYGYSYGYYAW